jgi:hypothetical protein
LSTALQARIVNFEQGPPLFEGRVEADGRFSLDLRSVAVPDEQLATANMKPASEDCTSEGMIDPALRTATLSLYYLNAPNDWRAMMQQNTQFDQNTQMVQGSAVLYVYADREAQASITDRCKGVTNEVEVHFVPGWNALVTTYSSDAQHQQLIHTSNASAPADVAWTL